jgi:hypothetical protein
MDDIENLEAQISYLQEDIGQRLQLLSGASRFSMSSIVICVY